MTAYAVMMAPKVSERWNDLGVKCQVQIYLKSVLWLVIRTPLFFHGRYLYFMYTG